MSVEQTTQLIQLILNSVLMSVACALVLGGLTARHSTFSAHLQSLNRLGSDAASHHAPYSSADLLRGRAYNRTQLRRFQSRYQLSRYSVMAAYYALFFSVLSCFSLALRGLLQWNSLITVAMGLFVLGITVLLLAIGFTLIDLHLGDFSMGEEVKRLLQAEDDSALSPIHSRSRMGRNSQNPSLGRTGRQKMRAG